MLIPPSNPQESPEEFLASASSPALHHLWHSLKTPVYVSHLAEILVVSSAVAALLVWSKYWRVARHSITWAHEWGHALMAMVLGGSVKAIRLSSDTSGVTTTQIPLKRRGDTRFITRSLIAFAGYPAPAVFGALLVTAAWGGFSYAALFVATLLMALTTVFIRNWWGLLIVVVGLALLGTTLWVVPVKYVSWPVVALGAFMLVGGLQSLVETMQRRRRVGIEATGQGQDGLHTDSANIADMLGINPATIETLWLFLWVALAAGVVWLAIHPLH